MLISFFGSARAEKANKHNTWNIRLRCVSCFNSYLHMMLMNVVGSVSVLRYIWASFAIISTWLWYFLKVKCKKENHILFEKICVITLISLFTKFLLMKSINTWPLTSPWARISRLIVKNWNGITMLFGLQQNTTFFCSAMLGINARKRF